MPSATFWNFGSVRHVFGNLTLLLGGKAGAGLISLAYLVIVARTLGASDYGLLILIHGYVTLVGGLVAFSGWHGLVRFGTIAMSEDDHERLLRVGRFLTLVELACGIAAIVVAAALVPVVGPHMDWPPEAMHFATFYCLAILANVRSTPLGVLQLAGRFDLIAAHHVVAPSVRLVGCVVVWLAGGGLIAFLSVWLVAAIAEWASMWALGLYVLRCMKLDARLIGPVRGTIAENEGFLPFIATTNIDISLRELSPRLVPIIIGWTLTPAAAGLFALAQRASTLLEQPATLLGQASYSIVAKFAIARDRRGLRNLVWRSAGTALLLSVPVIILLAIFNESVLRLLGGESFEGGGFLLLLLACSRAIAITAPPFSAALIAMGLPSRSILVNLTASLIFLPLLPIFLSWFGLTGAGAQAILQALFASLMLSLLFQRSSKEMA